MKDCDWQVCCLNVAASEDYVQKVIIQDLRVCWSKEAIINACHKSCMVMKLLWVDIPASCCYAATKKYKKTPEWCDHGI